MLLTEMEENFIDVGSLLYGGLNHTMFHFLVRLTLSSLLLGWYFNLISYLLCCNAWLYSGIDLSNSFSSQEICKIRFSTVVNSYICSS